MPGIFSIKKTARRDARGGLFAMVILVGIIVLTGCSPAQELPFPTQANSSAIPSQAATPTESAISSPRRQSTLTGGNPGSNPTAQLIPTRTPPNKKSPTPTLPILAETIISPSDLAGALLTENLPVISPDNISKLAEMSNIGRGDILTLSYSPDETLVAAVTYNGVYFYSTSTYEMVRFVPVEIKTPMAVSSSLRYLAMEREQGSLEIWDLNTGQLSLNIQVSPNPLQVISFKPDDDRLYISDIVWENALDEKIYILDFHSGQVVNTLSYGADQFLFSKDGKTQATIQDLKVFVWLEQNPAVPVEISSAPDNDCAFALSPDGKLLAIEKDGDSGIQIDIWRVSDRTILQTLSMLTSTENGELSGTPAGNQAALAGPGKHRVTHLAFSVDGLKLAALNGFGLLHQWQLEGGILLDIIPTESNCFIYSPSGGVLAAWQYSAEFYRVEDGQIITILDNHVGNISDLEFSPDSHSLMASSWDGRVWWRRVSDGGIIRTFKAPQKTVPDYFFTNAISDLDYSKDGSHIVIGTNDGQVLLWSTAGGDYQELEPLCKEGNRITSVSLSFNNQYLALQRRKCGLEIITLSNLSTQLLSPDVNLSAIPGVFSPIALWLAAPSDKGVEIFNIPDLSPIKKVGEILAEEAPPRFSDDGQLLALSDHEGNLEVWNISNGSLVIRLEFHPERARNGAIRLSNVRRIAISPDNRLLAASFGQRILLFDLTSGEGLGILLAKGEALDFSPDGKLLAVGGSDGVVYLYAIQE